MDPLFFEKELAEPGLVEPCGSVAKDVAFSGPEGELGIQCVCVCVCRE